MKKRIFTPLLFTAAIFMACNSSDDTASADSDTASNMSDRSVTMDTGTTTTTGTSAMVTLDTMDRNFAMKAASGGMAEVQLANMAMQNASSERVKSFASMMIRDHGQANTELKTVAGNKGVTLPTDPMPEHAKHMDMLKGKTGKAFDQAYMNMMVTEHQKDVSQFEKASNSLKDADLKGFATKTLPTLRMHLDSARAISKGKM